MAVCYKGGLLMLDTTPETRAPGNSPVNGVSRRRVLQGLAAFICVAGVPARTFSAVSGDAPAFFTDGEMAFITALADTLIPRTDTPGAAEAGVPAGFDDLMRGWASGERRVITKQVIAALNYDLDQRAGRPFLLADSAERLRALEALDADAYGSEEDRYGDYRDIKALLVRLYYASKPGATIELRYDPIPGGYDGDVAFAEIGRTWAPVELGKQ